MWKPLVVQATDEQLLSPGLGEARPPEIAWRFRSTAIALHQSETGLLHPPTTVRCVHGNLTFPRDRRTDNLRQTQATFG